MSIATYQPRIFKTPNTWWKNNPFFAQQGAVHPIFFVSSQTKSTATCIAVLFIPLLVALPEGILHFVPWRALRLAERTTMGSVCCRKQKAQQLALPCFSFPCSWYSLREYYTSFRGGRYAWLSEPQLALRRIYLPLM